MELRGLNFEGFHSYQLFRSDSSTFNTFPETITLRIKDWPLIKRIHFSIDNKINL